MIIAIRTSGHMAELHLLEAGTDRIIESFTWEAHRTLAATIHRQMRDLLQRHGKAWADISGLIVYQGPGSFTGLRIGATVANALADSLSSPIVAGAGDDWLSRAAGKLMQGIDDRSVEPVYGAEAHTTAPKK
jgi:tRNA threonylcarbamoyladenosine biosynthesis protein TsaB